MSIFTIKELRSHVLALVLGLMAGLVATIAGPASAHEVRPAYLEIREDAPDVYAVLFKTPMQGDLRLALAAMITGVAEPLSPARSRLAESAMVQTWRVRLPGSLAGRTVGITGLEKTVSDALLRVEYLDGRSWTQRLTPASPQVVVPAAPTGAAVARTYGTLGVEHILTGFDHLLFVLGLVLLSRGVQQLVWAITAFTVAHSITLAATTLGLVHVPQKAVEAIIALSIVFVAVEVIYTRAGRVGLAARAPWVMAFGFGLLHGFGFAGALREIGMPQGFIPAALLFFNVGVEIGQFAFVAMVLTAATALSRLCTWPAWSRLVPPYLIGSLAMFWVFQRVAQF